jgi:hypothetical protein
MIRLRIASWEAGHRPVKQENPASPSSRKTEKLQGFRRLLQICAPSATAVKAASGLRGAKRCR